MIRAIPETVLEPEGDESVPIVLCTDLQAELATLAGGAGAQRSVMGASISRPLLLATARAMISAHYGLPGNKAADGLAKEVSSLPQDTPVNVRNLS